VNGKISFADYVTKCLAADTLTEKLDLAFNRTSEGEAFEVVMERTGFNKVALEQCTVDAIISGPTDFFPLRSNTRLNILFCPPFSDSMKSKNIGYYTFDRKELGAQVVNSDDSVNNDSDSESVEELEYDSDGSDYIPPTDSNDSSSTVDIRLNALPNCLFANFQSFHQFKTWIFFPSLYAHQRRTLKQKQRRMGYLTSDDLAVFINQIFLPAAKRILCHAAFNKLDGSFEQSLAKGVKSFSAMFIDSINMNLIVSEMRSFLSNNTTTFRVYSDFFFVTAAFGAKEVVPSFENGLDIQQLANGVVDWEQMGNKTFVQLDFGLDLVLKNKDFSTFFLCMDHGKGSGKRFGKILEAFCERVTGEESVYPAFFATDFGGFSFIPSGAANPFATKAIGYSDFKNPFYIRGKEDRHGEDYNHEDLHANNVRKFKGIKVSTLSTF
jgi:hypothetical protein